ncbi:MAG: Hsp20/alpha crystallin family protein [Gammaproteobacteria bacterium]|nr:Hsp20/alpha crystallin family protein [Gammaproteobacteria bacterium]
MNLISWSPFRELDDFFERYTRDMGRQGLSVLGENVQWRPSADIVESGKEYTIKADLPEVKKEDIDVKVENGVLTLSGERRVEKSTDDEKEHRREAFYGRFSRSFSLPEDVDASKISADCKDGVLKVHLPKTEAKKPKSIEIKVD